MKMKTFLIISILIIGLFLTGCKTQQEGVVITLQSPFIGGTNGLKIDFEGLRTEVFDQGEDPFDVIVKLENIGESPVSKNDVKVTLTGFNPAEFGKSVNDLMLTPDDDLIEVRKGREGERIPGQAIEVSFEDLNFGKTILGELIEFPIRADMCYTYSTEAVSKLCVRENILNPKGNGICKINEAKTIFNSGGPIQITQLTENARSKEKIAFSVKIENQGLGSVYKKTTSLDKKCNKDDRKQTNKLQLEIDTGMPGLKCTGFTAATTTGTKVQGDITLYDGTKVITCTQVVSKGDYEQIVGIKAIYDYEEKIQDTFTVRSSGDLS